MYRVVSDVVWKVSSVVNLRGVEEHTVVAGYVVVVVGVVRRARVVEVPRGRGAHGRRVAQPRRRLAHRTRRPKHKHTRINKNPTGYAILRLASIII